MATHWHLLQEDPILNKYIGQHPEIVFREPNRFTMNFSLAITLGVLTLPNYLKVFRDVGGVRSAPGFTRAEGSHSPMVTFFIPNSLLIVKHRA